MTARIRLTPRRRRQGVGRVARTPLGSGIAFLCVLVSAWVAAGACAAAAERNDLPARDARPLPSVRADSSAGGEFVLDQIGAQAHRSEGGDFQLLAPCASRSLALAASCTCFCGGLFADGFETGDLNEWSSWIP